MTGLAVVVLAAGKGERLRPLTDLRPKPLCPVNNVPLIEHCLQRLSAVTAITPQTVAVNAHHLADLLVDDVGQRATMSVEQPVALGTAGAVGALRPWVAGRDVLIANADTWVTPEFDTADFVAGWDARRPRLLVVADDGRPDFVDAAGRWRFAGVSLLPWSLAERLAPEPAGLYEVVWSKTEVDLRPTTATVVDCGTPQDYLRANLLANGGNSVIGTRARIDGEVIRSVVWPGGVVRHGERLVESIRVGSDLTVPAPQG